MRSPLRILGLIGALGVIVLAAVMIHRSFDMPIRAGAPGARAPASPAPSADTAATVAAPEDEGEDVVARALRLAAIDTKRKDEWVDDIPDLELRSLSGGARRTFLRIANGRRCGCGCGFTLAGCRRFDSECETSGPRARALYDSVRAGWITSAEGFRERPSRR